MKKTQKCRTCGLEQPYEEFYKQKSNKLGIHTQCKSCKAEYNKGRRPRLRPKPIEPITKDGHQICRTCGVEKEYGEFYKKKGNKLGINKQCKLCKAEYDQEYRANNETILIKRRQIYYTNNKPQVLERVKIYQDTHQEEINAYKKTRRKNDPLFRRCKNLSSGLNYHRISIGSSKNGQHTFDILGYSKEIFNNRLDTYLDKPCQRCENITITNDNSDMDHIIPGILGKTNDEQDRLFHWTNLRLICSRCNREKNAQLSFDNAIVNPELFDEFVKPLLEEQGKQFKFVNGRVLVYNMVDGVNT